VTNFKSGSGNLDFDSETDEESVDDRSAPTETESPRREDRTLEDGQSAPPAESGTQSRTDASSAGSATSQADGDGQTYPYFVRRSNVGDERDTRLEIHVRDKVADGEAEFRHALATALETSDVSKTDAREFALLAAFRHPERVAELMREEGFDSI